VRERLNADGIRMRVSPQAYYSTELRSSHRIRARTARCGRSVGTGASSSRHPQPDRLALLTTYRHRDDATFGTVTRTPYSPVNRAGRCRIGGANQRTQARPKNIHECQQRRRNSWFADPNTQASKATAWTVGLNWYLTQNVGWYSITRSRTSTAARWAAPTAPTRRRLYQVPGRFLARVQATLGRAGAAQRPIAEPAAESVSSVTSGLPTLVVAKRYIV